MNHVEFGLTHYANSTRYDVYVREVEDAYEGTTFLVAVPNFFFSMTTPFPDRIAYKLKEKGFSDKDATNIEEAIRERLKIATGVK